MSSRALSPASPIRRTARQLSTSSPLPDPTETLFGYPYTSHKPRAMHLLLIAAGDFYHRGLLEEHGKPLGGFIFDRASPQDATIKQRLWSNMKTLAGYIDILERRDLEKLLEDLFDAPLSTTVQVKRYYRASAIPGSGRMPFVYRRFLELDLGPAFGGELDEFWIVDKAPKYTFKLFGRTYEEHDTEGLGILYETSRQRAGTARKIQMWLSLFRFERTIAQRSRDYLQGRCEVELYGPVENRHGDRAEWDSCNSEYVPAVLEDHIILDGFEPEDCNIGEMGIYIPQPYADKSRLSACYQAAGECGACLQYLTGDHFPLGRITSTCLHEARICTSCLQDKINGVHDATPLTCPSCREPMTFEDISKWASEETLKDYGVVLFRDFLNKEPEFHWCLSTPSCQSGQWHFGCDARMDCNECGFVTCIQHGIPWHQGDTCEEFDARNTQNATDLNASLHFMAHSVKVAPCCGVPVEKSMNCDHMTCEQCGGQFCYVCLADWDPSHGIWCYRPSVLIRAAPA